MNWINRPSTLKIDERGTSIPTEEKMVILYRAIRLAIRFYINLDFQKLKLIAYHVYDTGFGIPKKIKFMKVNLLRGRVVRR